MRAVQLHAVEAGLLGANRCGNERIARGFHFIEAHRPRAELVIGRRAMRRLADQVGRAAHAGMVQLHHRMRAGLVQRRRQPRQAGQVLVIPDAELPGKPCPLRLHMRGAGHRHAKAAFGALRQPFEFVIAQRAVGMALHVGQRGQHETVLQGGAARESQGGMEIGHAATMAPGRAPSILPWGQGARWRCPLRLPLRCNL
jgi:hypothetical protein